MKRLASKFFKDNCLGNHSSKRGKPVKWRFSERLADEGIKLLIQEAAPRIKLSPKEEHCLKSFYPKGAITS